MPLRPVFVGRVLAAPGRLAVLNRFFIHRLSTVYALCQSMDDQI